MKKPAVVVADERHAYKFRYWYTIVYPCSRSRANGYVQSGELETFVDHGRRMVLPEKSREFVAKKAKAGRGTVDPKVSAMKSAAGKKGVEAQRAMRRESEAA